MKEPPFLKPSLSPWSNSEAAKYHHGSLKDRTIACVIDMHLKIDRRVVVELKAAKEIDDAHLANCLSYPSATHLPVGVIIKLSEARTRIKRVMRSDAMQTTEKGREGDREGFPCGLRIVDKEHTHIHGV